jgi:hypothetical protein
MRGGCAAVIGAQYAAGGGVRGKLMLKRLFIALGLSTASVACADSIETVVWPDLPTTGFISGRPASKEDIAAGNAAFSLSGQSDGALPIKIPQYVLWSDETGKQHPMILVQAERAPDGTEIVGLRDFNGAETVGTLPEIKLLGTEKPQ